MSSSLEQPSSPRPPSERPGSASPFAWPAPFAHGPATVVNPERRGVAVSEEPPPAGPRSSVWQRLFPSESDSGHRVLGDLSGIELDHFTLEDRIGVGGMGTVFLANDRRLKRYVALKVLSPAFARDPAAVQRFQNEARAAARLDHDNIARVYYYGEDQGLNFIAYEFVTGTNIRDLIRQRGRLDPAEAVNYTLQVAAALNHTAAAGVVHRDIKPSNIIITPAGKAKLVDLGLARKESVDESADLTMAGTTLGTFDYISPEQARDPRNVDVRSDIYSLGCTLYHMLAGEPPYPEGTVLQKLLDHQASDPPDPARKNRRVPPALSAIVRRMMASDPDRRYANPDELIRDLLLVARALGLRIAHPDSVVWVSPQAGRPNFFQRNAAWLTMAAALLFIVVLLDRFPNFLSEDAGAGPEATSLAVAPHLPNDIGPQNQQRAKKTSTGSATRTNTTETPTESVVRPDIGSAASASPSSMSGTAPKDLNASGEPKHGTDHNPLSEWAGWLFTELGKEFLVPPEGTAASPSENRFFKETPPEQVLTGNGGSNQKMTFPPAATTSPTTVAETTPPATAIEATNSSRATPAITAEPPFLVDGKPYHSLEAACAAAADGSLIELRYNGRRREREKPLKIDHKSLTVRAAKGYRPTITFATANLVPEGSRIELVTVLGGSLNLFHVDLEVRIPDEATAGRWVIFNLQRAGDVRLKGVNLTVVNPGRLPTAIAEVSAAPGQPLSTMGMMTGTQTKEPVQFEVTESLVRGGTQLFAARDGEAAQVVIEQSVLALTGTVLSVYGSMEAPDDSSLITLTIKHATNLLGGNLIRLDSSEDLASELPHVHVDARSSLFALTSELPLVDAIRSNDDLDNFRRLFTWTSERNFFDQVTTFLSVISRANMTAMKPLGFEEWKRYWGSSIEGPRNQPILWRTNWRNRDFIELTKASAGLDEFAANNPAVSGAPDGSDAGADLTRLPADPLPPSE